MYIENLEIKMGTIQIADVERAQLYFKTIKINNNLKR